MRIHQKWFIPCSQGLVCSTAAGGHRVKVPETAEKCSQSQGFPPRMINTLAIWSDYQYHQFDQMVDTLAIWSDDQYFCNLISRSIRWKFDWMFNTLEILSNDRFHQVDMIQIILWFALGRDLLICDLNMFDVEKLLLIMMCDTSQCDWDIKIESICDNQRAKFYPLEASATHDKVARSFSSLVIFQYFFTVATPLLKCRADFGIIARGKDVLQTNLN